MDKKNAEALRDPGARKILTDLVNIPSREYRARKGDDDLPTWGSEPDPETEGRAKQFIERYGPLRDLEDPLHNLIFTVAIGWALRYAWAAPGDDEKRIEAANATLSGIVNFKESRAARAKRDAFRGIRLPKRPLESPILQPDILSGEWTLKPRDLADALAQEVMRSRKMLHICERPECGRYFVKEFSRDRYCSNRCSEEMRKVGQREWAKTKYHESSKVPEKPKASKGQKKGRKSH
jgi:hypothetical protein